MKPGGVPYPLIWGGKQPQLRLQLVKGEQVTYSMTNYNLFLRDQDFSEDGTYTIARFLGAGDWGLGRRASAEGFAVWGGELYPALPPDEQFVLALCWHCRQGSPCQMFVKGIEKTTFQSEYEKGRLNRIVLWTQPELQKCPVLSTVIEPCKSQAERKFAELYYRWALLGGGYPALEYKTTGHLQTLVDEWQAPGLNDSWIISTKLIEILSLPALIPQVWLNYAYNPNVSPKDIERTILRDMPSRVDFLLIKGGQSHVIEIDDPGHYADLDGSGRWKVNEERYTRNLRIERRLKREKLHIHRFSNWEVLNSPPDELLRALGQELAIEVEDLPF